MARPGTGTMERIKFLDEGKIVEQNGIATSLFLPAAGSFRKKTMVQEMSTMCLLSCKQDAECARLLFSGSHGVMASPVDARDQLTLKLLHVVDGTDSANTNLRLLDGWPLALFMASMRKEVQVKSSMDKSTEDLPSYLPDLKAVRIVALAEKTRETREEAYIDAEGECATGYLTACSAAELGDMENVMKHLGFGFIDFEIEEGAVNAEDHILGKTVDVKDAIARAYLLLGPNYIPFPKPLSLHPIEVQESVPDHQYPIPAVNVTGGFSYLTETQQVDAFNQSNAHGLQGNNWCSRSTTERVPIFVRQISGKSVVLIVNLDEPSEHMMCLYEEKTKMKFTYQYFRYQSRKIDPDHTLLFYGVGRNSTVHAYGRLLGGMPTTTLSTYVQNNKNMFLKEVTLPSGQISLKITKKGCRFLNTWLKCFTKAFSMGKSWNGEFTLDNFKHIDGHILIITKPRKHGQGSMINDLRKFVELVEQILLSDKEYLISKYPPYLKNLTRFLSHKALYGVLSAQDKLFLETHVCCMTSCDRERLVIKLYRRYEGLDSNEMIIWDDAIQHASCPDPWFTDLSEVAVYKDMIEQAIEDKREYSESKFGAFTLIKDIAMHATDNRNGVTIENVNGIELMVPSHLEDFLPSIIKNLIERNVDISAELLAATIKCFCKICESADSSDSD